MEFIPSGEMSARNLIIGWAESGRANLNEVLLSILSIQFKQL